MDINPSSLHQSSRVWIVGVCLLLCLGTFVVYYPGLSGDFEFDDSVNILNNHALEIEELTPGNLYQASITGGFAGPLKRPVSIATFVINRYLTGVDPFYMKLTNVTIHAINALGIFLLSFLLVRICFETTSANISVRKCQWLALAITAAWVLHPLALTSNLYIIQRMTSLSALFSICGLITFVVARRRMINGRSGIPLLITGLIIFGLLSAFSKENGLLLPLFMLVIEITLFKFSTRTRAQKHFLYGLFILTIAIPAVLISGWLIISPDGLMGSYTNRSFDLNGRILTEARVLWLYLYLILLPNISQMGIYHDDIVISQGLLTPWTTLPALAGLIAIIIFAVIKRKSLPILSFGLLFFFAGHSLESTIFPLEIAHEHRNYLPMFGIIFCVVFYIMNPLLHPSLIKIRSTVTIVFIALMAISTSIRASYWGNLLEHSIVETNNHPASARAQYQTGRIYWKLAMANPESKELFFLKARNHYELTANVSANKTVGLISLIHLSFFAEFDMEQHWLDQLIHELQNKPVPASTPNMLHALTMCHINNRCRLTYPQMLSIYTAALSNTMLKGNIRSSVLSSAGRYTASHEDFETSLNYFYQAAETASGYLDYRLMLIDLLTKLNMLTDAQHQLDLVKSEDKFASYTKQIAIKEKALQRQKETVNNMEKSNIKAAD